MKELKGVIVALLVLAAVALMVNNVVLPLWRRPSRSGARHLDESDFTPGAPSALSVRSIPASNGGANPQPPAVAAPVPVAADLSSAQTNATRWVNSPSRDPFLMQRTAADRAANYRTAMDVLTLKAIWHQTGGAVAVIDTQVVGPGDVIQGYKVISIGAERVWVDGPIGREELTFDHTANFRSAVPGQAAKPDGFLESPLVGQESRLDWPYRAVDGVTNNVATDSGWFPFIGKVVQKIGTGSYVIEAGEPTGQPTPVSKGRRFIVKNLPLALVDDDPLPAIRCKYVGDELQDGKTLRAFDFGVLCAPPKKTAESLEAQKTFVLQQYQAASKRRVALDIAAAERGSAASQFILGQRYLAGEGVPRDAHEGRRWLEKSAAQGNRDALEALQARGKQ